jgi:hypothetical protein
MAKKKKEAVDSNPPRPSKFVPFMTSCKWCGTIFLKMFTRNLFCTKKCGVRYHSSNSWQRKKERKLKLHPVPMNKQCGLCPVCGKLFPLRSVSDRGKLRKTCSESCRYRLKHKAPVGLETACEECGTVFVTHPYHRSQRFCSRNCLNRNGCRRRYHSDPEKHRQERREWAHAHPDKVKETSKKHYAKSGPKPRQKRCANDARYRINNASKIKESNQNYLRKKKETKAVQALMQLQQLTQEERQQEDTQ